MTKEKELTQEQIIDAEKFCQLKQGILVTEWPLIRTMLIAYMDGIGTGLQLSEQGKIRHRADISIERNKCHK